MLIQWYPGQDGDLHKYYKCVCGRRFWGKYYSKTFTPVPEHIAMICILIAQYYLKPQSFSISDERKKEKGET